jgi:hypothetical protein
MTSPVIRLSIREALQSSDELRSSDRAFLRYLLLARHLGGHVLPVPPRAT